MTKYMRYRDDLSLTELLVTHRASQERQTSRVVGDHAKRVRVQARLSVLQATGCLEKLPLYVTLV